jgi:hypothetical protein
MHSDFPLANLPIVQTQRDFIVNFGLMLLLFAERRIMARTRLVRQ